MYIVIAATQQNKSCGEYFNTYVYPRLAGPSRSRAAPLDSPAFDWCSVSEAACIRLSRATIQRAATFWTRGKCNGGGVAFMAVWGRTVILLIRCGCTANFDICPTGFLWGRLCEPTAVNKQVSSHNNILWCAHRGGGAVFKLSCLRILKITRTMFYRSAPFLNVEVFSLIRAQSCVWTSRSPSPHVT